MTAIGDAIPAGQPIPDDVIVTDDAEGHRWVRTGRGHWHTSEDAIKACAVNECYEDAAWKMKRRYPLTVTAVREQPAERAQGFPGQTFREQREAYEAAAEPERPDSVDLGEALDEAVGYYEAARAKLLEVVGERGEARAEVERLKDERDKALTWRDQMQENSEAWRREAESLRVRLNFVLGELAGYQDAPAQPDPLVLRLQEVPEGTESVVGMRSGRRYEPNGSPLLPDDSSWRRADDGALFSGLGSVLDAEAPHGVRVEPAPPRKLRTAAEVWHGLASRQEQKIRQYAPELAEALDREAGLTS